MKYTFGLLILSLIIQVTESREKLRMGAIELPPFFSFPKEEDGVATGIAVDRIVAQLGRDYELEWVRIPLARGEFALNKGIIDIYSGFAKNDVMARDLWYSKSPYLKILPIVCGKILKDFKEKRISDIPNGKLKGKNLIFPRGSAALDVISKTGLKLLEFPYSKSYFERAKKMISLKRADLFLLPSPIGFKIDSNQKCLPVSGPYEVFYSFKKGNSLKDEVDLILSKSPVNEIIP